MEERSGRKIMKALGAEDQKYPCVWYEKVNCPIRTKWKLAPENLTPWCTVCKQIGYLDEQKEKTSKEDK